MVKIVGGTGPDKMFLEEHAPDWIDSAVDVVPELSLVE